MANELVKASENKMELQNDFVYVRIDSDLLFARDLTDKANEESLYTQSKRWLKKSLAEIVSGFNVDFTFETIASNLRGHNIKYRRYCGMD